jgi:hypothetical protein
MNLKDERLWARCHADGARLFHEGHDAEAERRLHQAIRHAEAAGIADARLASTHYQLAMLAQADHRWADAERHYREALAAEVAGLGADHPYVAMILRAHARLLHRLRRAGEAADLERRADAIWYREIPRRFGGGCTSPGSGATSPGPGADADPTSESEDSPITARARTPRLGARGTYVSRSG